MTRTESNSSVNTYKACPAKYRFHYSDFNRPTKTSYAMRLGNLVHEAFAYSLQGHSTTEEALAFIDTCFVYEEEQAKAREIISYYFPLISLNGSIKPYQIGSKRCIEKRFETKVGGVSIIGYIDAIIEDRHGNVVLVDWKTRGELLDGEQIALDSQLYVYAYVAKMILGIPITKVCQVQMKTKLPAKPILTKKGVLSKTLGATTRSVFVDECIKLGVAGDIEVSDYKHKFVDESEFLRVSYIDIKQIDTQMRQFVDWINKIESDTQMLPVNNANICKWCQYRDLCIDNK